MNRSVRWLPPLVAELTALPCGPAFDGNVTERETLARMLTGPGAPEGAVDSDETRAITASSRDRVTV